MTYTGDIVDDSGCKKKLYINVSYPKTKKALNKKKGQIGGNTLGSGRTPAGGVE